MLLTLVADDARFWSMLRKRRGKLEPINLKNKAGQVTLGKPIAGEEEMGIYLVETGAVLGRIDNLSI